MNWHVQFVTAENAPAIERFPTPESAIEAACKLLDLGRDVFGIGTGPLSDSIDRLQIKRIYAIWKAARPGPKPSR
jgi:hypothetical protein